MPRKTFESLQLSLSRKNLRNYKFSFQPLDFIGFSSASFHTMFKILDGNISLSSVFLIC